ncbi:MAG: aminoglycoside phosphotransferase family protein [Cellulosilyticaceae bacterium]
MKNNINFDELKNIAQQFNFDGDITSVDPWGNGHINDTFVIKIITNNMPGKYILQKINKNVFTNPAEVMENIEKITAHLKTKIAAYGGDVNRETLNIIPTKENANYAIDSQGDYWRVFAFIDHAISYEIISNPNDFYNSAKAFGKFQKLLADFPADTLHETIPNFHHTISRYETFLEAVKNDKMGRAKDVQSDIQFVIDRKQDTETLLHMLEAGELPLRVTHNDTKINNVMVDESTGEGICVIDLDTVMPGLSLYDFGDSIRSGATSGLEDEPDLSKIWMELPLFEIYTKGFMESVGDALTENEVLMLPMGAKVMTFECGIRFLTDHLNGDTYFKIHREGHNLDRARTQFKLVSDMEAKWSEMMGIVKSYIG